jgi:hypothetical protein
MQLAANADYVDLDTLLAVIARSPIAVPEPPRLVLPLPEGFDRVDAVILDWISAEGRRLGRRFARM